LVYLKFLQVIISRTAALARHHANNAKLKQAPS